MFARVGIAAGALVLAVYASGQRMPRSTALWGAFLVMGALNNLIPFSLIFWGQTRITGGLAAILNATTPLFTVVLAHFLTRDERMTPNRLGGVLLGVAGVVVLIGPAVLHELGLQLLAQIAVLGAALSYALAGIFGRRFRDVPPLVSAAGQVSATTIMMLPVVAAASAALERSAARPVDLGCDPRPRPAEHGARLSHLLSPPGERGATNLLLVTFLIPVSAIVLGASLLGERLEPRHFGGMALIGLGLAAIDGRALRLLRRRGGRPRPPEAALSLRRTCASCPSSDLRPSSGGRLGRRWRLARMRASGRAVPVQGLEVGPEPASAARCACC